MDHLRNERRKIAVFAQIQSGLENYQAWGRKQAEEDPLELLNEKHHPTKVLAQNMIADGRPKPSNRHSPHHIVQGKGRHPRTTDTRLNLHLYGIRINDPDNGVWLPRTKFDKGHWSMPDAPAHSEIHTFNYETWINFLIGPIEGELAIRSALIRIRSLLRDGRQPSKITEKKDVNWRPTS
ncbi:AHH domain-containing protein [Microbulbifer thermotolerans]|uniref:AHH domain-containing protein n=1 Tax=Microbulbifer thermotolerans TaxID=252514 RepID=UPI000945CEB1|nr:AHH domain-containing protein [Microbulbifer thermotolerans]